MPTRTTINADRSYNLTIHHPTSTFLLKQVPTTHSRMFCLYCIIMQYFLYLRLLVCHGGQWNTEKKLLVISQENIFMKLQLLKARWFFFHDLARFNGMLSFKQQYFTRKFREKMQILHTNDLTQLKYWFFFFKIICLIIFMVVLEPMQFHY